MKWIKNIISKIKKIFSHEVSIYDSFMSGIDEVDISLSSEMIDIIEEMERNKEHMHNIAGMSGESVTRNITNANLAEARERKTLSFWEILFKN